MIPIEKRGYGTDTHWFFGKEKSRIPEVNKEGHADSYLGEERLLHYWLLWMIATANDFKLPNS